MTPSSDTARDVEVLKDWRVRVDGRLNNHQELLGLHDTRISKAETLAAVRDEDVRWIKGSLKWALGLLVTILLGIIPLVVDFVKWGITHDWKYLP